jgi:hypothetical protein
LLEHLTPVLFLLVLLGQVSDEHMNCAFVQMSKPFLNEVTWYLELLKQIELLGRLTHHNEDVFLVFYTLIIPGIQCLEKELPDNGFHMSSLVPTCYHAYSNYYWGEVRKRGMCIWIRSVMPRIHASQNSAKKISRQ